MSSLFKGSKQTTVSNQNTDQTQQSRLQGNIDPGLKKGLAQITQLLNRPESGLSVGPTDQQFGALERIGEANVPQNISGSAVAELASLFGQGGLSDFEQQAGGIAQGLEIQDPNQLTDAQQANFQRAIDEAQTGALSRGGAAGAIGRGLGPGSGILQLLQGEGTRAGNEFLEQSRQQNIGRNFDVAGLLKQIGGGGLDRLLSGIGAAGGAGEAARAENLAPGQTDFDLAGLSRQLQQEQADINSGVPVLDRARSIFDVLGTGGAAGGMQSEGTSSGTSTGNTGPSLFSQFTSGLGNITGFGKALSGFG